MAETTTQIDDGGPAFPSRTSTVLKREDGSRQTTMVEEGHRGLSLRDYFAAKAMQGLIACDAFRGPLYQQEPVCAAGFAYAVADAMIRARAK